MPPLRLRVEHDGSESLVDWSPRHDSAVHRTGEFPGASRVLEPARLLQAESLRDNQDWDWYTRLIPFFECPDRDLTTTYPDWWEVVAKQMTHGSPDSGFRFTESIDRPFWSGSYGAFSYPAGHQLSAVRWLKDKRTNGVNGAKKALGDQWPMTTIW